MRQLLTTKLVFVLAFFLSLTVFAAVSYSFGSTFWTTHQIYPRPKNTVFCYYENYAVNHASVAKVAPEDLDPFLCTHIAYSFFGVSKDAIVTITNPIIDIDKGGIKKFLNLKKLNPAVKLVATIGGSSAPSAVFSKIVNSDKLRLNFVRNLVTFIVSYGFDGVDIDWEFPGFYGGLPTDREKFVEFLRQARSAFDRRGLVLSVAIGASPSFHKISYDIRNISKYVDFINIMFYNYHSYRDKVTGFNAPLYPNDLHKSGTANINASLQHWLLYGANRTKINLGLPFYGQTYTLENQNHTKVGAKVLGPGIPGPYLKAKGVMSYLEICKIAGSGLWTIKFDYVQKSLYAFRGNQWIGFDNEVSLGVKTHYALSHQLSGVMIWAIDQDDVTGNCGREKWPLLKAVNAAIAPKTNHYYSYSLAAR